MSNFPTSLPSYTITAGSETLNGAAGGTGLSGLLNAFEVDITALGTKMGTGAATPSAGKVLRANGTGTSTWGAVVLTTDVTGTLPVGNGGTGVTAASTGSGGAVLDTGATITSPVMQGNIDAWIGANESWTFASSNTITVPTNATTKYDVGDFIKITQSATVKYFVVTIVASTLLTVSGLAGVTVANSAITANAYSKGRNPHSAIAGAPPFNPYKFSVYRSGNQTVSSATWTKVQLNATNFDTSSNFDAVTNFVFTAPIAGFYQFNGGLFVSMSNGNTTAIGINVNTFSSQPTIQGGQVEAVGSTSQETTISVLLQLSAADTVQLYGFTSQTTFTGGAPQTYLQGYLVSAI